MTDIFTRATVETKRLRLEPYALAHASALNAINNEPQIMEFLSDGNSETIADTQAKIANVRHRWETLGFGWWAIIDPRSEKMIGAVCLKHVDNVEGAELEIGWRLTASANGHGYATEAGIAATDYAFDVIGVDHVIAVADERNIASHRVMERIGMQFRSHETHYGALCKTYVLNKSQHRKRDRSSFP